VLSHRILKSGDDFLSIPARREQGTLKHLVAIRVQARKAEIFKLPKDLVEAESVGDGCEEL
jgi:hypothetical protein